MDRLELDGLSQADLMALFIDWYDFYKLSLDESNNDFNDQTVKETSYNLRRIRSRIDIASTTGVAPGNILR